MRATQAPATRPLPEDLESSTAKLVYLYLERSGPAPPREVASALGLRRLDLLGVLSCLADSGHVERTGDRYAAAR